MRLVNGVHNSTVYSGRVEVVVNGEWGIAMVCNDGWDTNDATVVCRQLGYPVVLGVYSRAHFGRSRGIVQILLGDLQCRGEEESLADCRPRSIGQDNCTYYKDAEVTCSRGKKYTINSTH